jgi:hypothetical protein
LTIRAHLDVAVVGRDDGPTAVACSIVGAALLRRPEQRRRADVPAIEDTECWDHRTVFSDDQGTRPIMSWSTITPSPHRFLHFIGRGHLRRAGEVGRAPAFG